MTCPNCNNEMRKGFLFTSKDGAFSFADEVPGVLHNAKKAEGFIEITPLEPGDDIVITARRRQQPSRWPDQPRPALGLQWQDCRQMMHRL